MRRPGRFEESLVPFICWDDESHNVVAAFQFIEHKEQKQNFVLFSDVLIWSEAKSRQSDITIPGNLHGDTLG